MDTRKGSALATALLGFIAISAVLMSTRGLLASPLFSATSLPSPAPDKDGIFPKLSVDNRELYSSNPTWNTASPMDEHPRRHLEAETQAMMSGRS